MPSAIRLGALVCLATVCFSTIGCSGDGGPPTVHVKGKLTQGGAPLTYPMGGGAILRFYEPGAAGDSFDAVVSPDGTYEVDVATGPKDVAVQIYDVYPGPDRFNNKYQGGNTSIKVDVPGATESLNIDVPAGM